jgi:Domain of unknown function (DUF1707)
MGELVRASDRERDRVVEELKEQAVAGRLTLSELAERVERAYSASTRAELEALTPLHADPRDGRFVAYRSDSVEHDATSPCPFELVRAFT